MVTRKQYPKEFKLDAISLVLEQGHTPSEVFRSLEINGQYAEEVDQGVPKG